MRSSLRLGSIGGIRIGANWSLLVIAGLLTLQLASVILPGAAPGFSGAAYVAMALFAAVAFLVSILLHELGHAAAAQREGVPVKGITLWLLGGVAILGAEPRTARAELRIAVAGPVVSLALAVAFGTTAWVAGAAGQSTLVVATFGWMALINGALALFNLLPAAPLDGGRILKAYLWHRRGDRDTAMVSASDAGTVLGGLLIGLGVLQFTLGYTGGLWQMLLGWFIVGAAKSEQAFAEKRLRTRAARLAMTGGPPLIG